eukprot:UN24766
MMLDTLTKIRVKCDWAAFNISYLVLKRAVNMRILKKLKTFGLKWNPCLWLKISNTAWPMSFNCWAPWLSMSLHKGREQSFFIQK